MKSQTTRVVIPSILARDLGRPRVSRLWRSLASTLGMTVVALATILLLAGCQSNQSQPSAQAQQLAVPRAAEVVAEGSRDLSYKAPADGRLYAMDQTTQTVAFSKRVRAGQKLDFRADNGTVALDGRPQRIANLDQHRGHAFRLYFEKGE